MRYSEIIAESSRAAPLYHMMDFQKAMSVFAVDCMPARWEHEIPKIGLVRGNSFTRNSNFSFGSRSVRLVMNQTKLSYDHKIIPLDGEVILRYSLSGRMTHKSDRAMNNDINGQLAEEFVIGDIDPLHRYITVVQITPNYQQMTGAECFELRETVAKYCEEYRLPYQVHPKFEKHLADTKQRWDDEAAEDEEAA